ncbi:unnamed protein product [Schistosoma curassoni]|nr:unnamed protein product [Schistosoma curassoni]
MRYIPPLALLISVYLIVTLLCDIYNCQGICQQRELAKYEKVIFVNATYKYTHYYNYSQRIRTKQSNPVVNGTFETFNTRQVVQLKFPFKYYETNFSIYLIQTTGSVLFVSDIPGLINHIMPGNFLPQFEMLHNNESIAVKWYFRTHVNDTCKRTLNDYFMECKILALIVIAHNLPVQFVQFVFSQWLANV